MKQKIKIDNEDYFNKLCDQLYFLNEEQKELLRINTTFQFIAKGKHVYREHEIPIGFISLLEGNVKIFQRGVSGRNQIIRLVRNGGIIGYRALFANEHYLSSSIALSDSTIAVVKGDVFGDILKSNGELSFNILHSIAKELGIANRRTMSLTQKHIRGRLADSLLFLRDLYGVNEDGRTIAINLSREDLAELCAMTRSNVIRTLSSFVKENVLEVNGRWITILNLERLTKICELG